MWNLNFLLSIVSLITDGDVLRLYSGVCLQLLHKDKHELYEYFFIVGITGLEGRMLASQKMCDGSDGGGMNIWQMAVYINFTLFFLVSPFHIKNLDHTLTFFFSARSANADIARFGVGTHVKGIKSSYRSSSSSLWCSKKSIVLTLQPTQ